MILFLRKYLLFPYEITVVHTYRWNSQNENMAVRETLDWSHNSKTKAIFPDVLKNEKLDFQITIYGSNSGQPKFETHNRSDSP